ncbi:MAG: NlpC/P60 family protein, partial [Acidimicrobiales bacterium]
TSVTGIPGRYLALFVASGARFGVPWAVLGGIYSLECDFGASALAGCNPRGSENPAGAQGPGQWMPGSWRRGLSAHQLIPPGPPTASVSEGYATDGDGDGVADPWDPADAVAATARLLAADGAASGDVSDAVFQYNHDAGYVEQVLARAAAYQVAAGAEGASPTGAAGGPRAGAADTVVTFAEAQIGEPYQWGGSGPAYWDCSGLVQAAYHQVGLDMEHNAAAQLAETSAAAVPLSSLEPGDLVFFGSSAPTVHHVGIYVGAGSMVDAPNTGARVRIEGIAWSDLLAATRPLALGA